MGVLARRELEKNEQLWPQKEKNYHKMCEPKMVILNKVTIRERATGSQVIE
jgi:hypothetical protein